MIKRSLILPVLILLLTSFSEPKYCKLSDRILAQYVKELQRDEKLHLYGHGGSMMNDVKVVEIYLLGNQKLSVDEARELFVKISEELIARYNNSEKIRPFLHNYPFTINNIDVQLAFQDENRRHQTDGNVALVFIAKQSICYCSYDRQKECFLDLHSEPYEEGLAIVNNTICKK